MSANIVGKYFLICYNVCSMVQVTRKDQKEANENIIRRFNRRVLQSGVLARAKNVMRFEKPISKAERRKKAIVRRERRAEKNYEIGRASCRERV